MMLRNNPARQTTRVTAFALFHFLHSCLACTTVGVWKTHAKAQAWRYWSHGNRRITNALSSERKRRTIQRDATRVTMPPETVLVKKSSLICGRIRGDVRWPARGCVLAIDLTHLRVRVKMLELGEQVAALTRRHSVYYHSAGTREKLLHAMVSKNGKSPSQSREKLGPNRQHAHRGNMKELNYATVQSTPTRRLPCSRKKRFL